MEDAKALEQRQKIQADLDLITTIDQKAREISTQGGAKVASLSLPLEVWSIHLLKSGQPIF